MNPRRTVRSLVSTAIVDAACLPSVGRLRPCNIFDWKFTVLSHNTIRGAAGAAVLNGELLKAQGYLG